MYAATLFVHSWLRWAVVLLGLLALVQAVLAPRSGRPWTPGDDAVSRWFVILFDVQVLIGLLLYLALSPLTQAAFADFGAAMGNSILRYWAVEHLFGMLVALACVHVGRAKARRARTDADRHRSISVFFGIGLFAMLISIPWPGMPAGRPLLFW